MSNAAKTKVGGTYYEIVKAQYKKNGPAVWSLWTLVIVFFLATYAPLVALDVPFTTDLEGVEGSPWFNSLIDPAVFPLPVDIFFNLLMFTLPVVILLGWFTRGRARRVHVDSVKVRLRTKLDTAGGLVDQTSWSPSIRVFDQGSEPFLYSENGSDPAPCRLKSVL